MNAQDLKNSILQLAVQGKLVEQRPEEGTAKELLAKIKAEKEQLIKDKKIKKEKPLPEITDEEKPFEIPESWEWVRLSELCDMYTGNSISDAIKKSRYMNICEGYDYIGTKDVQFSGKIDYENGVKIPYTDSFRIAKKNSILMCIEGGSAGRKIGILDRDVCFGNKLCMFNPLNMINRYVFYTLQSPTFIATFKEGMTGIIGGVSLNKLKTLLIAVPPLEEQKRIVSKIEELLPYIKQYDKAYTKLETFNKKFPEDMKKSILQYAIRGRLVEQRPEEGNAEDLYKQIVQEKAKLIKEGKIKKEKPLAEITDDEIPFEIPANWKWVRLGEIFSLQAGKTISANDISDTMNTKYKYPCFGGNGIRGYVKSYNRQGKYALIGRQGALCGNINISAEYFYATEHAVVVNHFNITEIDWGVYFLKALNLNQYATATAQPGLSVTNIVKVLIPLPPLEEQKRIVARLEEILPYCNQLVK